jgi:hypothetical protein
MIVTDCPQFHTTIGENGCLSENLILTNVLVFLLPKVNIK